MPSSLKRISLVGCSAASLAFFLGEVDRSQQEANMAQTLQEFAAAP